MKRRFSPALKNWWAGEVFTGDEELQLSSGLKNSRTNMVNSLILLIDEMTCDSLKFVYDTKDEFTWTGERKLPSEISPHKQKSGKIEFQSHKLSGILAPTNKRQFLVNYSSISIRAAAKLQHEINLADYISRES